MTCRSNAGNLGKHLKADPRLPISHLSLYNLTIEPHTVFFKYRDSLSRQQPDPETSLQMYQTATENLAEAGLEQYEISAFAKPNFFSRHNVGYWTGRSFLGFGPSAFSYWKGKRFRNVANLSRYCKTLEEGTSPIDFEEELEADAKQRELLAINLRMIEGVNLETFQARYDKLSGDVYETLKRLEGQGLLKFDGATVAMTPLGILHYDTIATEIV